MGTMLQRYKLTEADYRGEAFATWPSDLKGNHDLLNITRPDVVAEVHRDYFLAGADIVETNTFNANAISQNSRFAPERCGRARTADAGVARGGGSGSGKGPSIPRRVSPSISFTCPWRCAASTAARVNSPLLTSW